MKKSAIFLLPALAILGWVSADGVVQAAHSREDGAAPPPREVLSGSVVVQRDARSGDVVVAVDGGEKAADGVADRVFVLQRDAAPAGDAARSFASARVLYENGNVLVAPADGSPALGLFLRGQERLSAGAAEFLAGAPLAERWSGDGMARRRGEVRMEPGGLTSAAMERVLNSCGSGAAKSPLGAAARPSVNCPGGGSTDCTNSTCQILCIPGYTACCDCTDPNNCKCRCVRN